MGLLLRLLSIIALVVSVLAVILAVSLYWQVGIGGCEDECDTAAAYALSLPMIIIAVLSAIMAAAAHFVGKQMRASTKSAK